MGLSPDDLVQVATGSFTGTSGSVTLNATTAGNAVLILAGLGADGTNLFDLSASGFTEPISLGDSGFNGALYAFIKSGVSAGEASWTLTVTGGSQQVAWAAFELSGIDVDWPGKVYITNLYKSPTTPTAVASHTCDTGGATSETFSGLTLAGFFAENAAGTTPTINGYTNGFEEIANQTVTGTRAHRLAVAVKVQQQVEAPSCTASISPDSYASSFMLVFTGVDSLHVPDVYACFGAEIGTATNLTTSTLLESVIAPWDEVVGTPEIVTTNARSGVYCMKFSSTSAAENVAWARRTSPAGGTLGTDPTTDLPTVWVDRLHVYFDSLPGIDVDLASWEVGSLANGAVLWYRTATQKLGIKIGTGTEIASDAVIVAGQHIGVDVRYDPRTTTHVVDWAVDYNANPTDTTAGVFQTQATTAGMTAGGISKIRKGHTSAVTVTYYMDDLVGSKSRKTFPLGDLRIFPLQADPAGTPTVFGTAGNFRTFTNNGTLATWTAAATVANLTGVPPIVGAAAKGFTQITTATGDYVEVPMAPFTCAPDYVPVGGRWYWAGWAASGNPAQFGFAAYDGDSQFAFVNPADAEFDNSTLRWVTKMHRNNPAAYYPFPQSKLDALAFRGGFSNDANPDAGVLFALFELVVFKATAQTLFGSLASTTVDPFSRGIVGISVSAPTDYDTNLYYETDGTPITVPVTGGTTHDETLNALDAPTTNYVAAYPAAEPHPT